MIFARTPVKQVGLDLALQLFDCYVKPIFEYWAIVWTSEFRKSYDQKINESLLLFLKKYLMISKRIWNISWKIVILKFLLTSSNFWWSNMILKIAIMQKHHASSQPFDTQSWVWAQQMLIMINISILQGHALIALLFIIVISQILHPSLKKKNMDQR